MPKPGRPCSSAAELTMMLVDVPTNVQVPPSIAKKLSGIIRWLGLIERPWQARNTSGRKIATAAVLLMKAENGAIARPVINMRAVGEEGPCLSKRSPSAWIKPLDCNPALSTNIAATVIVAGLENPEMPGGRCDACDGRGAVKVEMHFLADVWVPCDECRSKRYNRETLEVKYKGKTIADVLEMEITDARELFANIPQIERILSTLDDVGLGYLGLGQPATTLSGGEAQRVKLASELARRTRSEVLYLLDEPTCGLHPTDIERLVQVLHRLVDNGHTVVVVEHNVEFIRTADWIVDLGPEGGDGGGRLVAQGPLEAIVKAKGSYTGKVL